MKEKIQEKIKLKKAEWWQERDVLFTGIIIGILSHGYMMANKLPNIDDYVSIFHYGLGYPLGRWLLALMGNFMFRIDGVYSLPLFNGFFYVFTLSAAVTIFLKPFAFQSKWIKRGFAALFISFPTVTATMGFMFTAPFYGLAVLFMAVAFYILIQYRYGFLASMFLICFSLGIYQAYWGLIAGFLLLYLMALCMNDKTETAEVIRLAIKSLISLVLGVLLYLVINQMMLKIQGIDLSGYQGISQMGHLEISQIPEIIKNAYGYFFRLTRENYLYITWYSIIRIIIAAGYIISIVFCIAACIKNRKKVWKSIALIVFVSLFPLAVNSIYIMCNDATSVHTLMCYSVVLVFLIPFIFLNGITKDTLKNLTVPILQYGYLLAILLASVIYIRFANIYYLNLELAYEETYSFMETLSTRIQDMDNYSSDKQILFYGFYSKTINRNIWELRMVNHMTGTIDVDNVINSYLIRQNFSRIYLGNAFHEVSDKSIIDGHLAEIEQMPCYPDDGSIRIIDDVIIVKFSDQ